MDFFLEKNILEYFLKYIKQNPGRTVCVQLLQTLNILFENISNKTAIYYLLSNNHTNDIITHRFDFSDEEQRREFDLYVESIKLFCHPESMVRIAVRTITLNIHRVKDEGALEFIHHQASLPYFSYLVWSVGNTILDIDDMLRSDLSSQCRTRLDDLVAEHVDHLHYLNDLLSLNVEGINDVLCDHLLHRMLIPLHLYSLTKRYKPSTPKDMRVKRPHVSHPVAAFMLTQFFAILQHVDVIRVLTEAIFFGDPSITVMNPSPKLEDDQTDRNSSVADQLFVPSEIEDESIKAPSGDPALAMAHSLVNSTIAIRSARSADPGLRLAAYMEHTRDSQRYPVFRQPSESLETGLKNSKEVTPALLKSIWPANLAPLKLGERRDIPSEPLPISVRDVPPEELACRPVKRSNCPSVNSSCSDIDEAFLASLPSKKSFGSSSSVSAYLEVPCSQNQIFSVGSTPSFFTREPVVFNSDSHTPRPPCDTLFDLQGRPFLRALFRALEVGPGTDYETLFALLLFSTIRTNPGVDLVTLQLACLSGPRVDQHPSYDSLLIGKLLDLIRDACKAGSRVRLITLHLAVRLLTDLVCDEENRCYLSDEHFAQIISAREEAMMMLRSYFQNNAIFLDLFEYELRQLLQPGLSFSQLTVDSSLLIPPLTATVLPCPSLPLDKVHREHWRRLPRTETEHMQRAIGVYLLVHIWLESLLRTRTVDQEKEAIGVLQPTSTVQPGAMLFSFNRPVDFGVIPGLVGLCNISDPKTSTQIHKAGDKLDLSSEALIKCTVESGGSHEKRFLVNYSQQLVLVEPDSRQMGWGVITFIGPLQDLEATCDPGDSRCLHVTVNAPGHLSSLCALSGDVGGTNKPNSNTHSVVGTSRRHAGSKPLLTARFLFEDHIRCMTARQMLVRGRELARQTKLRKIATVIYYDLPVGSYASPARFNPVSDTIMRVNSLFPVFAIAKIVFILVFKHSTLHVSCTTLASLLDFSPQFLRETFVFGGTAGAMGYSSSFANTAESIIGASRVSGVDHDSRENTEVVRHSRVFNPNRAAANVNPSAFLMERQHPRTKIYRPHPAEDDVMDTRIPLVSLGSLTPLSGSDNRQSLRGRKSSATGTRPRLVDSLTRTPVALVQQQLPTQSKLPLFSLVSSESVDTTNHLTLSTVTDTVTNVITSNPLTTTANVPLDSKRDS
ncbi:protein CLEC16A [Paragonimus westermani]|uniref:Protein CLEC16A n=1 Tax=Paragonimus westermani TaxID=34504 RepID=A0A5J4NBF3_9TREM|nr:protein CLEC16A [Paragonimus westermani]